MLDWLLVFYNLQYLRFFAAGMVVLHHQIGMSAQYWPQLDGYQFLTGAAGVDIFFVISGFIMVFISEKRESSPLGFFQNRVTRVAPPYLAVTIIFGAALLLFPSLFHVSSFSLPHFLSSILFFPYRNPYDHEITPLYAPGWTLNYEFFFYSIFALAMAFNHKKRVLIVSLIFGFLVLVGFIFPTDVSAINFYTNTIVLEFVLGMAIGVATFSGVRLSAPQAGALLIIALVGFAFASLHTPVRTSDWRVFVWGLPAAALVAGAIHFEFAGKSRPVVWLKTLGDASYAIYITHFMLVGPFLQIFKLIGFNFSIIQMGNCFTLCIASGLLFHFWFEKPLIAFFRRPVLSIQHSAE